MREKCGKAGDGIGDGMMEVAEGKGRDWRCPVFAPKRGIVRAEAPGRAGYVVNSVYTVTG